MLGVFSLGKRACFASWLSLHVSALRRGRQIDCDANDSVGARPSSLQCLTQAGNTSLRRARALVPHAHACLSISTTLKLTLKHCLTLPEYCCALLLPPQKTRKRNCYSKMKSSANKTTTALMVEMTFSLVCGCCIEARSLMHLGHSPGRLCFVPNCIWNSQASAKARGAWTCHVRSAFPQVVRDPLKCCFLRPDCG